MSMKVKLDINGGEKTRIGRNKMKTNILHIIITLWAVCLACTSCSQEDITQPVSTNEDGQVKILYKIAGASLSRATEEGWDDEDNDETDEWHENIIDRIDLFVFNKNGNCVHHIVEEDINITDAQQEGSYTNFKKNRELTELTYSEVAANKNDYTYYMVANCNLDDITEGQSTLDELKAKTTSDLTFNQHPMLFAMDGKLEPAEVIVDETAKTATLQFKLKRAAVKIRVSVLNESETSIISQCTFRLHNYVLNGTSVLEEEEENRYGEGSGQTRTTESVEVAWSNVLNKDNQAVFYSYPNDWFDESLLADDGTFEDKDIYAKDNLIDETKQTYILLTAPFGENQYYYKVPVNYSIADYNDQVDFDKDQIETLRDEYYRMLRNHIYDITVTIDRAGGITEGEAETPQLYYRVAPYDDTWDIDVPAFN